MTLPEKNTFLIDCHFEWILDQLAVLSETCSESECIDEMACMGSIIFWLSRDRRCALASTKDIMGDLSQDDLNFRLLQSYFRERILETFTHPSGKQDAKLLRWTWHLILEQNTTELHQLAQEIDSRSVPQIKKSLYKLLPSFNQVAHSISLSRWLLTTPNYLSNQRLCDEPINNGPFLGSKIIDITIEYKSSGELIRFRINESMKLRTLMALFLSKLDHPPKTIRRLILGERSDTIFFMSKSAKASSLKSIGARNDDRLVVIGSNSGLAESQSQPTKRLASRDKGTSKPKNHYPTPKRKKKKIQLDYSQPNTIQDDREEHSKKLTLLFQAAEPVFREKRKLLNDLVIKNSPSKPKKPDIKHVQPDSVKSKSQFSDIVDSEKERLRFDVLVGHEDYLYKSSKLSKTNHRGSQLPYSIDLHGYSKDGAINALNENLSLWKDAAMKGSQWTTSVTIICGRGKQILSEAVEQWINDTNCVINRPKGFG